MMKNTKRSSKRKGKMNKKNIKNGWVCCVHDRTLCNPFERLLLENPGNSKQPALLSAD